MNKNGMGRWLRIGAAVCLGLALCAGCGGTGALTPASPRPTPTATPIPDIDIRYVKITVDGGELTGQRFEVPWDEVRRISVLYTKSGEATDITGQCVLLSGDPAVFTVSGNGLLYGAGAGSANLTVRCGKAELSRQVTVTGAAPTGVWLYDEAVLLPLALYGQGGMQFDMILCADFDNGKTYDATGRAAWQVANPAVAEVSGGAVTAKAPGKTTVTARYGSFSAKASVEVFDGMPDSLAVDAGGGEAKAGGSPLALNAQLGFGDRGLFPANGFIQVCCRTPEVARAAWEDGAYRIYGVKPGQAEIIVSAFGLSETVVVTVTE